MKFAPCCFCQTQWHFLICLSLSVSGLGFFEFYFFSDHSAGMRIWLRHLGFVSLVPSGMNKRRLWLGGLGSHFYAPPVYRQNKPCFTVWAVFTSHSTNKRAHSIYKPVDRLPRNLWWGLLRPTLGTKRFPV